MAFQLKNFASIVASMINRAKATQTTITDFNVGAVGRTLFEAPAAEMDELYQQMFNGLQEAIEVSVYNTFQFPALIAIAASGLIRLTITAQAVPVLISGNTVFTPSTSSQSYVTGADIVIAAGDTFVDIQSAASVVGAAGNLTANNQFTTTTPIPGFLSATNLSAFVNGRDAETPDERLMRFNDYITTLQRGTVASIEYGLSTVNLQDVNGNITEQVAFSSVVEPYLEDSTEPIALVLAYIHNGVGDTSAALVAQAQTIIAGYKTADGTKVPGWKAAGIPCNIFASTEVPVPVTAVLTVADGFEFADVEPLVSASLFSYLQSLPNDGATAIQGKMVSIAFGIAGVSNFVMSAPAADVTSTTAQKLMPGAIVITQGGV